MLALYMEFDCKVKGSPGCVHVCMIALQESKLT